MKNERLRRARKERRWTIEEACARIGVSRTTYIRWEQGTQRPQDLLLTWACKAFNLTAEQLGFAAWPGQTEAAEPRSIEYLGSALRTEETVLEERGQEIAVLSPQVRSDIYTPLGSRVLVPFPLTTVLETELDDWPTWFALKQTQILTIISSWNGRALFCDELQLVVDQEIKMLDEIKPQDNHEAYTLSRRQAIIAIAAFPLALLGLVQQSPPSVVVIEELLSRCAASITACWYLLRGSELSVVEQTVSSYLPVLVQLAQHSSRYQKTAARLVVKHGCQVGRTAA